MSDSGPSVDDTDDTLPEVPEPDSGSEPSLTAISIRQSVRQVQYFIPSIIEVIGNVADRHPQLAHKIVDDIIDKGQHRQKIELLVVEGDNRRADRGQLIAGGIAVLALLIGFVLIMSDHSAVGIAVLVTAIVPLVGTNLYSRYAAKRERLAKMSLLPARDEDGASDAAESD